MCQDGRRCGQCWFEGQEDVIAGILAWISGDHGDACRCDTCRLAIAIMRRGLPRALQLLQDYPWGTSPTPPDPPDDPMMNAAGSMDF